MYEQVFEQKSNLLRGEVNSPFQSSMLDIRSLVWGSEPGDGQVARLGHGDWENSFQTPKGEGT